MNKGLKIAVIALGVVIVVLLGLLIFVPSAHTPSAPPEGRVAQTPTVSADGHVSITLPLANATIVSAAAVAGSVTGGGWFFEGTFPVKVLDADGAVLGEGHVQAEPADAWMSTGTVAFAGTVEFKTPHYATGTLVFSKDNPSGLPANAGEVRVPVRFSVGSSTTGGGNSASGVSGRVVVSPTCPVERIPPDPACAPKGYATNIQIVRRDRPQGIMYKTIATDADGNFSIPLVPGAYTLTPQGGAMLPRCSPTPVDVATGTITSVTLMCDSGIR